MRTSNQKRVAFYGAALETFNLCFSRYALQIFVSLDSPTIARAAAGLAAIAAAKVCPKISFIVANLAPDNAKFKVFAIKNTPIWNIRV